MTDVYGDNEFNITSLIDAILPANLHVYAKNEHVSVSENAIKFVKKRVRCATQNL